MTPEEFETQARDVLEQALNQLNAATLLLAQLEMQLEATGVTIQVLSRIIETFTTGNQQEE
jgi:hypothetical protein